MAAETTVRAGDDLVVAINHTTRLRILRVFEDADPSATFSPKAIADELDETLGSVAYHVRHLAHRRRGMLELATTRPVRGAVEHFYRITPRGREALAVIRAIVNADGGDDA